MLPGFYPVDSRVRNQTVPWNQSSWRLRRIRVGVAAWLRHFERGRARPIGSGVVSPPRSIETAKPPQDGTKRVATPRCIATFAKRIDPANSTPAEPCACQSYAVWPPPVSC